MKKIKLILLSILFFCASANAQSRPDWIDNPSASFKSNEIYAVGTGESARAASADARANILKYFQTNIDSKFSGSLRGENNTATKLSQADIAETTNGIIKGINITNTYKDKDGFYALAVLDKKKTINELDYEIDQLDSKMKILSEDKSPSNSSQLEKMYLLRAELNKKYMFLTDTSIKEKVTYEDIFKSNQEREKLNFYIAIKDDYGIAQLKNKLSSLINENGNTSSNDIGRANRILTCHITLEKQYMKVDGFEKYKVNFRIENKNGSSVVGVIAQSYTETGRDIEQIYEKAFAQFAIYLDENYQKLLK
jgi:hypothetical protein